MVTPHPDALLKKLCESETSTFRKSKNLFCRVIWNLVHKVVRFAVFLFFLAIYPDLRRKWVNVVPELSLYCVTFHYGLGPAWNMNVWAVGTESILYKHISSCNSWFSRSPSLEQPLFPCLHIHCALGLKGKRLENKKNCGTRLIGQKTSLLFLITGPEIQ